MADDDEARVDVSPALIAAARAEGVGGTFHVGFDAEIIATPGRFGRDFAAVVANLALLDRDLEVFDEVEGWRPMPWYFRTKASWLDAIAKAWRIVGIEEPVDPRTGRPASLLIVAAMA